MELTREEKFKIYGRAYSTNTKKTFNKKVFMKLSEEEVNELLNEDMVKEYIRKCLSVIRGYISSNCSITTYRSKIGMYKVNYEAIEEIISILFPELYKEYLNIVKKREVEHDVIFKSTKDIIIDMMDNGVNVNNKTRDMDIVDYYEIVNMPIDDYVAHIRKDPNNSEDKKKLLSFFAKNISRDLSNNEIENFYNSLNIIEGTTITVEDKYNIIAYMYENNIPITNLTRNALMRRVVNDTFYDSEYMKVK